MDMRLTTTAFDLCGYRVVRNLGVVRGVTVRSRSLFGTVGAALQTLAGGNISLFTELCEKVGADLRRKGYVGRTVGLKLRFEDFRTVTRVHTFDVPTDEPFAIRSMARSCLKRVELTGRIRLLGVRVDSLVRAPET